MSHFEKAILAAIVAVVALATIGTFFGRQPHAPYSVPAPAPSPGPSCPPGRPFLTACPYCRRTSTVTPPAGVGETGQVVAPSED